MSEPSTDKARTWFDKALDAEKKKLWDNAVYGYLMGLSHDPENLDMYRRLIALGQRRKVAGGRPEGGFGLVGDGPLIIVLQALDGVAKDPYNVAKWESLVRLSGAVLPAPVGEWLGDQFLLMIRDDISRAKYGRLLLLKDHFRLLRAFSKARAAAEEALKLDPGNAGLASELRNLAAAEAAPPAAPVEAKVEPKSRAADFSAVDSTIAVIRPKSVSGSNPALRTDDEVFQRIRSSWEVWHRDPNNPTLLRTYADALLQSGSDDSETEAMRLLEECAVRSGDQSLRAYAGDIRMKRERREMDRLRDKLGAPDLSADDRAKLAVQHEQKQRDVLSLELAEFQQRLMKHPDDRVCRFEVGSRLIEAGRIDEAIMHLQLAEADPKVGVDALAALAGAFVRKAWFEPAVACLRRAIAQHPAEDDDAGRNLHHQLGIALEGAGKRDEALEEFARVISRRINFKDAADRYQKLKNRR